MGEEQYVMNSLEEVILGEVLSERPLYLTVFKRQKVLG